MVYRIVFLAALAALLLPSGAAAQDAPVADPPASNEDIVVEGTREQAVIYRRELGRAIISGQYPRWNAPICVRVIGLQAEAAALFRARINDQAAAVGVPVANRDNCASNIVIAWTDDGPTVAQRMYRRRARLMAEVPRPVRVRFLEGEDAVRWLPMALIGGADGVQVSTAQEAGITLEGGSTPEISAPTTRNYSASLIRQNSAASIASVTVIIDAERAAGVTLNAMADFVTMIALTGMPMSPNGGEMRQTNSILALFDSAEGRSLRAMTATDTAYLTELYRLRPDRAARYYRGRMNRAIEEGMAAEAAALEADAAAVARP